MTKEELIAMPLHEYKTLNNLTDVLRVSGGWLYIITCQVRSSNSGLTQTITQQVAFVPEK